MGRSQTRKKMIVTYCTQDYKPCLDKFITGWQRSQNVEVYTDSDEFGTKIFDTQTTNFQENMERKILSILRGLEDSDDGEWVLYLDSDVACVSNPLQLPKYALESHVIVTRAVRRRDRRMENSINAGVIYFKNYEHIRKFVREWYDKCISLRGDKVMGKLHEQYALDLLWTEYFDIGANVCAVSERIFNLEDDDKKRFIEFIKKYKPRLIHFKNSWWKDEKLIRQVYGII
jgi:hypothetical protein